MRKAAAALEFPFEDEKTGLSSDDARACVRVTRTAARTVVFPLKKNPRSK